MSYMEEAYRDARRLREIVAALFDAGFSRYVDAARLQYLVPFRARLRRRLLSASERERLERPVPVRVREAFERLGPTFVKFGQMLSLRADLVGEEFAHELARLQQRAPSFPFAEVERTVMEDLGKPLAKAFPSFERKPVAAASLAQVHRATLSGRRRAAVKIQRPGIRAQVERDMHLMLLLAHLIERSVRQLERYRPVSIVKEFADWTLRELDFTVEAANIDRFRANFSSVPEIRIPGPVWSHTTKRILTMEFIDGETIGSFLRKKPRKMDRHRVAETAVRALLKMYFIDGFFHADPHPGNFLLQKDGRIALLDFGMVGYLPHEVRTELLGCFTSYVARDTEAYARHLLELSQSGPEADIGAWKRDVLGILDRIMYRPARHKGMAQAFYRIVNLGATHDVHFPTDLVLFARSLITAEAVALKIAPDFDLDEALKPLLDEALLGQFAPERVIGTARSNVFDYLSLLRTLPERTLGLMKKLETGDVGVRVNLEELRDLKDEFDRENDIRIVSVVAAALFVGSAVLLQVGAEHVFWGFPIGHLALLVSLALFLWVSLLVVQKPRV